MARSRTEVSDGGQSDREPPASAYDSAGPDPARPITWVTPDPTAGSGGYLAARDPDFGRRYPTVCDFLTLTGAGGKQRKTGSVLFFAEDGKWKCCLNDRDGGNYTFVSADSFEGLLGALEAGLRKGGLDWRKSKGKR